MSKLTEAQRDMLRVAKAKGGARHALGGVRARVGGAKRRMMWRLIERGYLDSEWPWPITPAGRTILAKEKER